MNELFKGPQNPEIVGQALVLMGMGLAGVFIVLTAFFFIIRILERVLRKPSED